MLKIKSQLVNSQISYTLSCVKNCTSITDIASGINITCCTTDLCNNPKINARVNNCSVGGTYTIPSNGSLTNIPYASSVCMSPANQYCAHMTKNDGSIDFYLCLDTCTSGTAGGITYSCCNNFASCNPDLSCNINLIAFGLSFCNGGFADTMDDK